MNYIVKIIDGKPKIFGTTGKDNGAPVYVFQEENAFDAALAEGMIPVGALIVKTYDAVEMAGGPFDDALSDKSENAVKNLVIKAEVDRLDQAIADALALRASLTGFGLGKICPVDVTDVTEDTGLVLGAVEKNASVEGTLANKINSLSKRLFDIKIYVTRGVVNFSEGNADYTIDLRAKGFEKFLGVLAMGWQRRETFSAALVEDNVDALKLFLACTSNRTLTLNTTAVQLIFFGM